jgi:hypothetical protein
VGGALGRRSHGGWLILISTAGVVALTVVAVFFRILRNAAGLTA